MNKIIPAQQNPQQPNQPNQPNSRGQLRRLTFTKSTLFVGPLPDPQTLQGYEQACRGAANRIIKMAENQSEHRQKIEDKVISSNVKNERTAMFLSFILTGGLAIIGAGLLVLDKQIAGYISLFGPSVFHAGNYVYRKYVEKTESKKREEAVESAKKKKSKR